MIPTHLESGCLLAPLHLEGERGVIRKSIYGREQADLVSFSPLWVTESCVNLNRVDTRGSSGAAYDLLLYS